MENLNSIWDGFMLASDINHKKDEINRLKNSVNHSKNSCGSCYHWMTSQCPKETPKNKVTCNGIICSSFKIQPLSQKLIDEKEEKIKELECELLVLAKKGIEIINS